jgi:signal transduction histidine kinase
MGVAAKGVMARIRNGRFPVRSKLVAVLLLPVTLLLVLGASQVVDVRREAQEARAESQLAAAVAGPGSFLNLMVDERNHTSVYLLGAEDLISSVEPGQYLDTRELVDEARQEFLDFIAGQDEQVQAVYAPAVAAMGQLDELRADVDADSGTRDFQNVVAVQDLFQRFSEVTDPLFDANRRVSLIVTDPVLQQGVALVDQSLRQSDTIALLTYGLVVATLAGDADGVNTGEEYVTVATGLRDLRAGEQTIRLNGEGDYAEFVDALFASEHIQAYPELVESALETGTPNVRGLFANAGDEEAFGYDKLRDEAEKRIQIAVDDINSDAQRTQSYFTIGGLLVLLVLAAVTTLVARSITRPLLSLTRQAMAMAGERLPSAVQGILDAPPSAAIDVPRLDAVKIRTRDEVADVAQALTTVQDSALSLAVEQAALRRNIADSFVHLGRRNQTLLGRQLDFITELEQGETDPTALSNLFRLDHLATRMRRNAESLLVLAGLEPPRVWRVPVLLTDVVRAALGEIENYQRVEILGIEATAVVGSAAADVAHLLAEIIENALAFSPPHERVQVSGRYRPMAPYAIERGQTSERDDDGAFTITIADFGIGMSEEDVARANQRLAGKESFAIAPSQYLGHYVAGTIALRHGITVRLESPGRRGTTATVTLPSSLVSGQGASSAPAPASRAAFEPPPAPVMQLPTVTRGLHPGGRAGGYQTVDTYRVGDAEFHIDFGTTDPIAPPVPVVPAGHEVAQVAPPMLAGEWGDRLGLRAPQPTSAIIGPTRSNPAVRDLPASGAYGTTATGEAKRARYVRDTLSRLSAGLEQGRGAAARESDERGGAGDAGAAASPQGSDDETAGREGAGATQPDGRPER